MTASWHTLTPEALLSELCSNIATGLAESETGQRLQAYGPNELPEVPLFRERPRLLFTARNILTRPTPATTLPARPESAKTATSPKDTPCPRQSAVSPCALREHRRSSASPFPHFLKISLGSVILPIGTATNSHPLAPNSFSLVCIFWVSGRTSTILYWNRFGSCAFAANGCPVTSRNPNAQRLTPAINHAHRKTYVLHISPHVVLYYGCATRQLWPVPRSTFKGTDNPNFFPVASISVFTRCFASSNSFSGTSKINSSWTCRIIFVCGIS